MKSPAPISINSPKPGPRCVPELILPRAPAVADVLATLSERGKRYGSFKGHAEITQRIKGAMAETEGWKRLSPSQREALEMVAHKIGRILNGDPNYADSWHDIAGYASLVDKELSGTTL